MAANHVLTLMDGPKCVETIDGVVLEWTSADLNAVVVSEDDNLLLGLHINTVVRSYLF